MHHCSSSGCIIIDFHTSTFEDCLYCQLHPTVMSLSLLVLSENSWGTWRSVLDTWDIASTETHKGWSLDTQCTLRDAQVFYST